MKTKTIIVASVGVATLGVGALQSCATVATSSIGVAIIKQILLGGMNRGMSILKDKHSFKQSLLIENAMPSGLKKINSIIERFSPELVKTEKEFIAEAAAYTATVAEPILKNAINNLTSEDVNRIIQGESGMATQVLREKTYQQLVAAFAPKVKQKIESSSFIKTLASNYAVTALVGGSATENISKYATEQMVTGLFYVIQDYEKENRAKYLGK